MAAVLKADLSKKIIIGIVLLAIILLLTGYTIQKNVDLKTLKLIIANSDFRWIIPAILSMAVFITCEAINVGKGLQTAGYKTTFFDTIKYACAGYFFSSITPSASGGQPAQLVYMNRDGISVSHGIFSLNLDLLCFQTAALTLGTAGAVIFLSGGSDGNNIVYWPFILGAALSVGGLVLLVLLMFSRQIYKKIAGFASLIAKKFYKIKKKAFNEMEILRTICRYRIAAAKIKKQPQTVMGMVLVSFIELISLYSISYYSVRAIGIDDISWAYITGIQALIFVSVSSLPFPGAAGITEYGLSTFLTGILTNETIAAAIVLSRTLSFVFPVLATGVYVFTYSLINTNINLCRCPPENTIRL